MNSDSSVEVMEVRRDCMCKGNVAAGCATAGGGAFSLFVASEES